MIYCITFLTNKIILKNIRIIFMSMKIFHHEFISKISLKFIFKKRFLTFKNFATFIRHNFDLILKVLIKFICFLIQKILTLVNLVGVKSILLITHMQKSDNKLIFGPFL